MLQFIKTREAKLTKSSDGHYFLRGIVSDNKVDLDGDRISPALLSKWADTINSGTINCFTDHSHQLWDSVGVWQNAVVKDGVLWAEARLEDPTVNPKVAALIAKFEAGEEICRSRKTSLMAEPVSTFEKSRKLHSSKHLWLVSQLIHGATLPTSLSSRGNRSSTRAEVAGMLGVNRLCRTRRHETKSPKCVSISKYTNSFTTSTQNTTTAYADFVVKNRSHHSPS